VEFTWSPEDLAFKDDVEAFVRREWTHGLRGGFTGEDEETSQARNRFRSKLAAHGWLTLAWPTAWGGGGATPLRQALYNETMGYYGAPGQDMGVDRVGPTIMLYGTDEQKQEFLPRIVGADGDWCQGFSEPGAGSDLGSLQTRAVRDGDDFVINGQKIWTSFAHQADWMLLLARTDPDAPKHRGISMLIVDMASPGITVSPLQNLANMHGFNQVFFDNVRVPATRLIGELNRGWYHAMATLDFERSGIGRIAAARRVLDDIIGLYRDGGMPWLTPARRRHDLAELADLVIAYTAGRLLSLRVAWLQTVGRIPNYEASMSKNYGSEAQQRVARYLANRLSLFAQLTSESPYAYLNGLAEDYYLTSVSYTVAGGTSEINRNVIATRGLGLPRG
jgi:alkylation response protein AidB-like acyl-CoA dehydrogenase